MKVSRAKVAYGVAAAAFLAYAASLADVFLTLGSASLAVGWFWSDPHAARRGD